MKNPWVIIGVITVVLFGGAIWFSSVSTDSNNEGVEIIQHTKGNSEATVKLVEYGDFQCSACASAHPMVTAIFAEYGDRLNFEYKHFPISNIHPHALTAATAAEAAGQQGKFFEFHDLLFINQPEWSSSQVPSSFFLKYADELELDMDQFRRQMKSSVLRDKVKTEFEEGRSAGVTGTPSFFLNGEQMQFRTEGEFREQVAAAIDPSLNSAANEESDDTQTPSGTGVRFGL